MHSSPSTAAEAMWLGFMVFGICSYFGLRFLLRGLRNDILDATGHKIAGRGWFIFGGILMQVLLAAFALFAWRQGLFQ